MCGRFTLRVSNRVLVEQFLLPGLPDMVPRYNIAPTQSIAAIRKPAADAPRALVLLHWGLIPSWAKEPAMGNRMINARSESAAEKPAFRTALRKRRCLIPADGFYEWKAEGKRKLPYHIGRPDGRPFAFAGLWERWGRGESAIESCTILTTNASRDLEWLHDRMPVILEPEDYERWLDPAQQDAAAVTPLLRPYPEGELTTRAVSTLVNNPRNEQPECLEPLIQDG
jgi:putative SOS response-associated peptidase YedK